MQVNKKGQDIQRRYIWPQSVEKLSTEAGLWAKGKKCVKGGVRYAVIPGSLPIKNGPH